MNKLLTYEEYKRECFKNKYSKQNYENGKDSEERMKKAYEAYVFRYNALKQVEEYEKNIRDKESNSTQK